jgi:hypothetical protein
MVAHGFYGGLGNLRCMTVEMKRSAEAIHTIRQGRILIIPRYTPLLTFSCDKMLRYYFGF